LEWITFWLRMYSKAPNVFIYVVAKRFQQNWARRSARENLLLSFPFVTPMHHFTFLKRYIAIQLSTAHVAARFTAGYSGSEGECGRCAFSSSALVRHDASWPDTPLRLSKGFECILITLGRWIRPPLWSNGQSSWLQIQRSISIPDATKFTEKSWVWNGVHSASWVQLRS
jgi:hypothetical protein